MRLHKLIIAIIFASTLLFIPVKNVFAGGGSDLSIGITDSAGRQLIGVFDLRQRETFIQITNTASSTQLIHIQVFNVNENCDENDFFDSYTTNDTHVYDIRNILTNDGNPSGVELPDNAYGIFAATITPIDPAPLAMIGNIRIINSSGYEYRTNLVEVGTLNPSPVEDDTLTFNYNTKSGVILSDVMGLSLDGTDNEDEIFASDVLDLWTSFDVDIYDLNETPFSCRNVIFSCVNQEHPLYEELLDESGDASVASFEYGINNAIPHSRDSELLCPGNVISEGFVFLDLIEKGRSTDNEFILFVGLNNGNGRGSFDSMWYERGELDQ